MGAEAEVGSVTKSHSTLRAPDLVSIDLTDEVLDLDYVACIRSGSFADIGPRRYMEDEHVVMDDLPSHLQFPQPSAFYGVFDGHGGPEAASFIKKHAARLFLDDLKLPEMEMEESLRGAFQRADLALAADSALSPSSGTTALTAFIFGRVLTVANVGDCRAVLCRKGEAVDMSHDHKPGNPPERRRVEQLGGFVEDGYLNGVLSVSRALGDWDMKVRSPSPLVSDPELRHKVLTQEDEFLIMACDGIWDVMSSQQAVGIVRRGLLRHDDPRQCARDLVLEALRLGTFDNLTVIVVCFAPLASLEPEPDRLRCCSLSTDALCSLKSLLEGGGDNGR